MSTVVLPMTAMPAARGRPVRLIAGMLAATVAAGALAWWWQTTHWPVEVVRIDGSLAHADRDALKAVIARHARAGFFRMDLEAVRADLIALPWVRDASLRRIWPETLDVEVREHVPAATWNGKALVSREGEVFAPASLPSMSLPALAGPDGHGPAMLERLRQLRDRLAPLGLEVAAIEQDARRAWRVTLDNGVALRLGRDHHEERLGRFVAVWPGVLAPRAEEIGAVDLRYTNGFAVAWRDGAHGEEAGEGGA